MEQRGLRPDVSGAVAMMATAGVGGTAGASPRTISWLSDAVILAAALALWFTGLGTIDHMAMTDFGLPSILPWTSWASLAVLAVGFSFSLRRDSVGGPFPLLFLGAFVVVLHATPAIVYETLRYSWAWKHIGIVDYIQRHGELDPDAQFLAAYHNWPGFFVVSAVLASLFNLTPLGIANVVRFFPVFLNLVFLAILPSLYGRLSDDRRLVFAATAVFLLGNWVGQDYFSPQGTAYALYLLLLVLCLGPLAKPKPVETGETILSRLRAFLSRGEHQPAPTTSGRRVAATLAVLVIIAATCTGHQLTPILVILALGGLALLGRLSAGFVLFAVAAEVTWLFFFADTYMAGSLGDFLSDLGNLGSETVSKLADLSVASPGQQIVAWASRGTTAAVVVLAALGGLRRLINGRRDAAAIVLALAPFPLLFGTSYGGEILFRIYFYALPFLAFFAAALFFPRIERSFPAITHPLLAAVLVALAVGFVFANNGKDRQYRFTHDEIAAAAWLYETAPTGALILEGARSYPSQFLNYERFTYLPLSEEDQDTVLRVMDDPVAVLGRWLAQSSAGGFVIITRSQKAYVDDVGQMPPGALQAIEDSLKASARFQVVFSNADAIVLTLNLAMPGASIVTE